MTLKLPVTTSNQSDFNRRVAQAVNGLLGPTAGAAVSSFNTRTGAVTLISGDVTAALGFTPYNATNPSGYISAITSPMVTTALGYTPSSVTGLTGVQSVAAFKTGLSLVKGDVGLGSVDNTADSAKAVLSATKWTTARNLAGNSTDGSANVTFANKFIVQGTADAGLSAAQFLGALGTGIVKNTTTTGVLSIAIAGDFPTLNQSTTGSAASLTTGRTIAITGDLAWTSPSFDGSGSVTAAGTLATVNTNTGSWGSATQAATFTVNGKGLTTAAGNITITPAVGSITGLGTGVATALAVNVGSAGAFVTFNGAGGTPSSLTLTNATGLPVAGGGTGIASYAVGDIIYASASTTLSKLADVATGNVLISGGVTTAPAWGKVTLTGHVSGVLPTANGGTNTDVGTAWATYTPTITPNAGAFTTISVQGRWKQMGKTVFLHITILITTNGTASGYFTITAPTASVTSSTPTTNFQAMSCNQNPSGFQGRATLQSGTTTIFVTKYDGTFLGGDGQSIHITGCYEAA